MNEGGPGIGVEVNPIGFKERRRSNEWRQILETRVPHPGHLVEQKGGEDGEVRRVPVWHGAGQRRSHSY